MGTEGKALPREIRERMEAYRNELLAFGMREPAKLMHEHHWLFYKVTTDLTAFIINLKASEFYIEITYGYASTAFTRLSGGENSLIDMGVSDEDITIREKFLLCDPSEEPVVRAKIETMYHAYLHTEKDALLACAKEKRKVFIEQIAAKLKALGFKKKGNIWTYALDEMYYLRFDAQKSAYSDQYYFNICIGKNGTSLYGDCYQVRVPTGSDSPLDWQSYDMAEFDSFLDRLVVPALKRIIDTPLADLGKIPDYWEGCTCNRRKCSTCWMEKNLWESRAVSRIKGKN